MALIKGSGDPFQRRAKKKKKKPAVQAPLPPHLDKSFQRPLSSIPQNVESMTRAYMTTHNGKRPSAQQAFTMLASTNEVHDESMWEKLVAPGGSKFADPTTELIQRISLINFDRSGSFPNAAMMEAMLKSARETSGMFSLKDIKEAWGPLTPFPMANGLTIDKPIQIAAAKASRQNAARRRKRWTKADIAALPTDKKNFAMADYERSLANRPMNTLGKKWDDFSDDEKTAINNARFWYDPKYGGKGTSLKARINNHWKPVTKDAQGNIVNEDTSSPVDELYANEPNKNKNPFSLKRVQKRLEGKKREDYSYANEEEFYSLAVNLKTAYGAAFDKWLMKAGGWDKATWDEGFDQMVRGYVVMAAMPDAYFLKPDTPEKKARQEYAMKELAFATDGALSAYDNLGQYLDQISSVGVGNGTRTSEQYANKMFQFFSLTNPQYSLQDAVVAFADNYGPDNLPTQLKKGYATIAKGWTNWATKVKERERGATLGAFLEDTLTATEDYMALLDSGVIKVDTFNEKTIAKWEGLDAAQLEAGSFYGRQADYEDWRRSSRGVIKTRTGRPTPVVPEEYADLAPPDEIMTHIINPVIGSITTLFDRYERAFAGLYLTMKILSTWDEPGYSKDLFKEFVLPNPMTIIGDGIKGIDEDNKFGTKVQALGQSQASAFSLNTNPQAYAWSNIKTAWNTAFDKTQQEGQKGYQAFTDYTMEHLGLDPWGEDKFLAGQCYWSWTLGKDLITDPIFDVVTGIARLGAIKMLAKINRISPKLVASSAKVVREAQAGVKVMIAAGETPTIGRSRLITKAMRLDPLFVPRQYRTPEIDEAIRILNVAQQPMEHEAYSLAFSKKVYTKSQVGQILGVKVRPNFETERFNKVDEALDDIAKVVFGSPSQLRSGEREFITRGATVDFIKQRMRDIEELTGDRLDDRAIFTQIAKVREVIDGTKPPSHLGIRIDPLGEIQHGTEDPVPHFLAALVLSNAGHRMNKAGRVKAAARVRWWMDRVYDLKATTPAGRRAEIQKLYFQLQDEIKFTMDREAITVEELKQLARWAKLNGYKREFATWVEKANERWQKRLDDEGKGAEFLTEEFTDEYKDLLKQFNDLVTLGDKRTAIQETEMKRLEAILNSKRVAPATRDIPNVGIGGRIPVRRRPIPQISRMDAFKLTVELKKKHQKAKIAYEAMQGVYDEFEKGVPFIAEELPEHLHTKFSLFDLGVYTHGTVGWDMFARANWFGSLPSMMDAVGFFRIIAIGRLLFGVNAMMMDELPRLVVEALRASGGGEGLKISRKAMKRSKALTGEAGSGRLFGMSSDAFINMAKERHPYMKMIPPDDPQYLVWLNAYIRWYGRNKASKAFQDILLECHEIRKAQNLTEAEFRGLLHGELESIVLGKPGVMSAKIDEDTYEVLGESLRDMLDQMDRGIDGVYRPDTEINTQVDELGVHIQEYEAQRADLDGQLTEVRAQLERLDDPEYMLLERDVPAQWDDPIEWALGKVAPDHPLVALHDQWKSMPSRTAAEKGKRTKVYNQVRQQVADFFNNRAKTIEERMKTLQQQSEDIFKEYEQSLAAEPFEFTREFGRQWVKDNLYVGGRYTRDEKITRDFASERGRGSLTEQEFVDSLIDEYHDDIKAAWDAKVAAGEQGKMVWTKDHPMIELEDGTIVKIAHKKNKDGTVSRSYSLHIYYPDGTDVITGVQMKTGTRKARKAQGTASVKRPRSQKDIAAFLNEGARSGKLQEHVKAARAKEDAAATEAAASEASFVKPKIERTVEPIETPIATSAQTAPKHEELTEVDWENDVQAEFAKKWLVKKHKFSYDSKNQRYSVSTHAKKHSNDSDWNFNDYEDTDYFVELSEGDDKAELLAAMNKANLGELLPEVDDYDRAIDAFMSGEVSLKNGFMVGQPRHDGAVVVGPNGTSIKVMVSTDNSTGKDRLLAKTEDMEEYLGQDEIVDLTLDLDTFFSAARISQISISKQEFIYRLKNLIEAFPDVTGDSRLPGLLKPSELFRFAKHFQNEFKDRIEDLLYAVSDAKAHKVDMRVKANVTMMMEADRKAGTPIRDEWKSAVEGRRPKAETPTTPVGHRLTSKWADEEESESIITVFEPELDEVKRTPEGGHWVFEDEKTGKPPSSIGDPMFQHEEDAIAYWNRRLDDAEGAAQETTIPTEPVKPVPEVPVVDEVPPSSSVRPSHLVNADLQRVNGQMARANALYGYYRALADDAISTAAPQITREEYNGFLLARIPGLGGIRRPSKKFLIEWLADNTPNPADFADSYWSGAIGLDLWKEWWNRRDLVTKEMQNWKLKDLEKYWDNHLSSSMKQKLVDDWADHVASRRTLPNEYYPVPDPIEYADEYGEGNIMYKLRQQRELKTQRQDILTQRSEASRLLAAAVEQQKAVLATRPQMGNRGAAWLAETTDRLATYAMDDTLLAHLMSGEPMTQKELDAIRGRLASINGNKGELETLADAGVPTMYAGKQALDLPMVIGQNADAIGTSAGDIPILTPLVEGGPETLPVVGKAFKKGSKLPVAGKPIGVIGKLSPFTLLDYMSNKTRQFVFLNKFDEEYSRMVALGMKEGAGEEAEREASRRAMEYVDSVQYSTQQSLTEHTMKPLVMFLPAYRQAAMYWFRQFAKNPFLFYDIKRMFGSEYVQAHLGSYSMVLPVPFWASNNWGDMMLPGLTAPFLLPLRMANTWTGWSEEDGKKVYTGATKLDYLASLPPLSFMNKSISPLAWLDDMFYWIAGDSLTPTMAGSTFEQILYSANIALRKDPNARTAFAISVAQAQIANGGMPNLEKAKNEILDSDPWMRFLSAGGILPRPAALSEAITRQVSLSKLTYTPNSLGEVNDDYIEDDSLFERIFSNDTVRTFADAEAAYTAAYGNQKEMDRLRKAYPRLNDKLNFMDMTSLQKAEWLSVKDNQWIVPYVCSKWHYNQTGQMMSSSEFYSEMQAGNVRRATMEEYLNKNMMVFANIGYDASIRQLDTEKRAATTQAKKVVWAALLEYQKDFPNYTTKQLREERDAYYEQIENDWLDYAVGNRTEGRKETVPTWLDRYVKKHGLTDRLSWNIVAINNLYEDATNYVVNTTDPNMTPAEREALSKRKLKTGTDLVTGKPFYPYGVQSYYDTGVYYNPIGEEFTDGLGQTVKASDALKRLLPTGNEIFTYQSSSRIDKINKVLKTNAKYNNAAATRMAQENWFYLTNPAQIYSSIGIDIGDYDRFNYMCDELNAQYDIYSKSRGNDQYSDKYAKAKDLYVKNTNSIMSRYPEESKSFRGGPASRLMSTYLAKQGNTKKNGGFLKVVRDEMGQKFPDYERIVNTAEHVVRKGKKNEAALAWQSVLTTMVFYRSDLSKMVNEHTKKVGVSPQNVQGEPFVYRANQLVKYWQKKSPLFSKQWEKIGGWKLLEGTFSYTASAMDVDRL